MGLPASAVVKNPLANAGEQETWVRSLNQEDALEKEMATHSCLENPTDRGSWWAIIHGIANSWTRLSMHACIYNK